MANQYQPDPRQLDFIEYYFDRGSETYANALQSALKAGYKQEYAESITHKMPDWLAEKVGDEDLISRAEEALSEALNYLTVDSDGKVDAGAGRLKLEAAKIILKGLRKDKYSERSEITGKDGKDLNTFNEDQIGAIAERLTRGKDSDGDTPSAE